MYLGCPDRKGEGSLQHLRWLHCPGGRLFTWEALRRERRRQQVSRTQLTHGKKQTNKPKNKRTLVFITCGRCSPFRALQPAGATVSRLKGNRDFVLSAPHPQSYHYPGQGCRPHVSRVHTRVRETATAVPGKKEPSSAPFLASTAVRY